MKDGEFLDCVVGEISELVGWMYEGVESDAPFRDTASLPNSDIDRIWAFLLCSRLVLGHMPA